MTSAINNCQMQIENILVMVNAYAHNNDFVCDRNKYMQVLTIFRGMRTIFDKLCHVQADERVMALCRKEQFE
jgi:hypothetical protein